MTYIATLTVFSELFVKEDFRDRFVHEATKKPNKLLGRISHRIGEVFPAQYRNRTTEIDPSAQCLVLGPRTHFRLESWATARKSMGYGAGLLVIDISSRKFYAETEGSPKHEVWAGDA
jgi:hypothetical protein